MEEKVKTVYFDWENIENEHMKWKIYGFIWKGGKISKNYFAVKISGK